MGLRKAAEGCGRQRKARNSGGLGYLKADGEAGVTGVKGGRL